MLVGLMLVLIGCPKSPEPVKSSAAPSKSSLSDKPDETGVSDEQVLVLPKRTASDVLDTMVTAYKNASTYSDTATLLIEASAQGQVVSDEEPYTVALDRSGKARLNMGQGVMVIDGDRLWGISPGMSPGQILRLDAPESVTFESLYPDSILATAMIEGSAGKFFSWAPIQLHLLLADDPLQTILNQSDQPELIDPAEIDQQAYYRVRIPRLDGTVVLWIHPETSVLRRCELPLDAFQRNVMRVASEVDIRSLMIEFENAQLDGPIDKAVFEFDAQNEPDAQWVERLLPEGIRAMWAMQENMLGKPVPEFDYVDVEETEGNGESILGKVTVIDLWATWCGYCPRALADLNQLYLEYKDDERIQFFAISIDKQREKTTEEVEKFLRDEIGVEIPMLRAASDGSVDDLGTSYPTTLLIDAKGIVQNYAPGFDPSLKPRLARQIKRLLAGEDVHSEIVAEQEARLGENLGQFQLALKASIAGGLLTRESLEAEQPLEVQIAPKSDPKKFKLTERWRCEELSAPGNLLVIDRGEQSSRILALDGPNTVVELDDQGEILQSIPLENDDQTPIWGLRTAVDGQGKRFFVGVATGAPQVMVYDDAFKPIGRYPRDAGDTPYGVGDARLADLDHDGTVELCVGFLDVTGLHVATLEGESIWRNRSVTNAMRVGVAFTGEDLPAHVLSLSHDGQVGSVRVLDDKGEDVDQIIPPNGSAAWLATADLQGDHQSELCLIAIDNDGQVAAVGVDPANDQPWSHPLPRGFHKRRIDLITTGDLLDSGVRQWIIAAADGSIHIIDSAGTLVDTFAYREELTGLGLATLEGKSVLLLGTPDSIDALQLDLPEDAPTPDTSDTPMPDPPVVPIPDTPDTPALDAPETPAMDAPETPALDAPETPALDAPETPALDAPETPALDAPETPAAESTGEPS